MRLGDKGITRLRREPWARNYYVELAFQDGKLLPWAKIIVVVSEEWRKAKPELFAPKDILVCLLPQDDLWEEWKEAT